MRLIGWSPGGNLTINRSDGPPLCIQDTLPWEGMIYARRSLRDHNWKEAAKRHELYEHLGGPPFLGGLTKVLNKLGGREKHLVEGFLAGSYSGARTCRCDETFDNDQRLWWHVWWKCPLSELQRQAEIKDRIRLPASRGFTPWMATGLFPDPFVDFPGPLLDLDTHWCAGGPDTPARGPALFGCETFSDGSTVRPGCEFTCRSGWAVVQIDSQGRLLTSAYGNLAG